ncbi:hypothetical protein PIB30_040825 [Stylosanthes scabra]|uniref:Uncharacterized protein n=1 Tax=Stylosanthes scabra TaxID=79078 RepID=A0ABU6VFF9_9FABA|nr:hypothetical protein [Stylosanthes scabra]
MARKTAIPRHLRHGAPSEPGSPAPPSSRGTHRRRSNTEPEPSPPPASRGKRPIQDEESPLPQPQRSGNSRFSLFSTPEPPITDPVAFKCHFDKLPAETFDSNRFSSLINWFFYKSNIANRPIVPQTLVSLTSLANKGLDFSDLFGKQGWLPISYQTGVIYPDLVHEFYNNMYYQDGYVVSFVRNTEILLDRYKIAEALGYHETGICVFTSGKCDKQLGVDYLVAVKTIWGGAAKKQASRGKNHAETSDPPRPPSGRRSSTGRKIKKIVKAMKDMMRKITTLVDLMIRFSKDCFSQETSDQKDLAKTKQLL